MNWEIPRDQIADWVPHVLSGTGDRVWKGHYHGATVRMEEVAPETDLQNLTSINSRIMHPNICLFMGTTTSESGQKMIVLEDWGIGTLHDAIHIGKVEFTVTQKIRILADIVQALLYLHPQPVHLSTMNVYLDSYDDDDVRAKLGGQWWNPLSESANLRSLARELFKSTEEQKRTGGLLDTISRDCSSEDDLRQVHRVLKQSF